MILRETHCPVCPVCGVEPGAYHILGCHFESRVQEPKGEFDDIIPLVTRLHERLKAMNPTSEDYCCLQILTSTSGNLHLYAQYGYSYEGSRFEAEGKTVSELLAAIEAYDPAKAKREKIAELQAELSALEKEVNAERLQHLIN